MGRRLRTGLAAAGLMLPAVLVPPQGAAAQEAPSIMVTPNTGLVDGQTVTVLGSGFESVSFSIGIFLCSSAVGSVSDPDNIADVIAHCDFDTLTDSGSITEGAFTTMLTVREVITTMTGETFDCTEAPGCVVHAANPSGPRASAPITFGPDVPTTTADCKNGGWRDLANDDGQPFRNQGGCVAWVASQK